MDEIRCKVEVREVEGKPARLVGTLLPFNEQAQDRAQLFERGSLSWPEGGIVLRRQHNRAQPILKVVPIQDEEGLKVDALIPSTVAGKDAAEEIRSGLLTGLSVEFRATKQTILSGVRRIAAGVLCGAGLVDSPSYSQATVEARAEAVRRASDLHTREFLL